MSKDKETKNPANQDAGTLEMALGASLGVYGVTIAITSGAICPACLLATPTLIGYGLYKKSAAKKNKKSLQDNENSE